jgi:hypothetical protein
MRRQKRSSTEPEPSPVEIAFIVALVVAVAACLVALWFSVGGEFARLVRRVFDGFGVR